MIRYDILSSCRVESLKIKICSATVLAWELGAGRIFEFGFMKKGSLFLYCIVLCFMLLLCFILCFICLVIILYYTTLFYYQSAW